MDMHSAFDFDSRLTDIQRESLRQLSLDDDNSDVRNFSQEFHRACAARLTRNSVMNYVASEALQHEMPLASVLIEPFDGPSGSIIHQFHEKFRQSCESPSQQIQYDAAKHIMLTIRALLHEMGVSSAVFQDDDAWRDECLMALTPQPNVESIAVGETVDGAMELIMKQHSEWLEVRKQWMERLCDFAPNATKQEKIRAIAQEASISDVIRETDTIFSELLREQGLQPTVLPLQNLPVIRKESDDEEGAAA